MLAWRPLNGIHNPAYRVHALGAPHNQSSFESDDPRIDFYTVYKEASGYDTEYMKKYDGRPNNLAVEPSRSHRCVGDWRYVKSV